MSLLSEAHAIRTKIADYQALLAERQAAMLAEQQQLTDLREMVASLAGQLEAGAIQPAKPPPEDRFIPLKAAAERMAKRSGRTAAQCLRSLRNLRYKREEKGLEPCFSKAGNEVRVDLERLFELTRGK